MIEVTVDKKNRGEEASSSLSLVWVYKSKVDEEDLLGHFHLSRLDHQLVAAGAAVCLPHDLELAP